MRSARPASVSSTMNSTKRRSRPGTANSGLAIMRSSWARTATDDRSLRRSRGWQRAGSAHGCHSPYRQPVRAPEGGTSVSLPAAFSDVCYSNILLICTVWQSQSTWAAPPCSAAERLGLHASPEHPRHERGQPCRCPQFPGRQAEIEEEAGCTRRAVFMLIR